MLIIIYCYMKVFITCLSIFVWGGVRMFNENFNNISVISWRTVLVVDGIGVFGENH